MRSEFSGTRKSDKEPTLTLSTHQHPIRSSIVVIVLYLYPTMSDFSGGDIHPSPSSSKVIRTDSEQLLRERCDTAIDRLISKDGMEQGDWHEPDFAELMAIFEFVRVTYHA